MARNFAQLVFWIYGLFLVATSRRVIASVLKRKITPRAFRQGQRGKVNSFLYLRHRGVMPPFLFWMNAVSVGLLAASLLLHLLIGWFSFAGLFMKIFNSLVLLTTSLQAATLSVADNLLRFHEPFFIYRVDEDPATSRAFASSIWDGVLYLLLPFLMILCNFLAL